MELQTYTGEKINTSWVVACSIAFSKGNNSVGRYTFVDRGGQQDGTHADGACADGTGTHS